MKKKSIIKIFAVILLVALSFGLVSCGYEKIELTEEEGRVIGTVGKYEVTYDELRYLTMVFKRQLEAKHGDDVWDSEESRNEHREELVELVESALKHDRAIIELSDSFGNSPDDTKTVEYVDEFLNGLVRELGGMRKYKKYLAENNMTDNFIRLTITTDYLESSLLYGYINLEIIDDDLNKIYAALTEDGECLRTRHIYVTIETDERTPEQSRELIDSIYDRLRNGESFEDLAKQYNEDTELDIQSGMHFLDCEVEEEYLKTAKSLKKGKFSKVITSAGGYVIIEKLEVDAQHIMLNIANFKDRYQYAELDSIIMDKREEMVFTPNEFYNSIDLTEMK